MCKLGEVIMPFLGVGSAAGVPQGNVEGVGRGDAGLAEDEKPVGMGAQAVDAGGGLGPAASLVPRRGVGAGKRARILVWWPGVLMARRPRPVLLSFALPLALPGA